MQKKKTKQNAGEKMYNNLCMYVQCACLKLRA